jgi:hypothetical protein
LLEQKLAFTVTATTTYEQAAQVVCEWGCPTDDATVHTLTQRLGARAEAQTGQRLASSPAEADPKRPPSPLTVLLLDGWQERHRGPGWGKKKTSEARVEWHELKTGVCYRHETAGRTGSGAGEAGGGRRCAVDLERGSGSVAGRDGGLGLLSCEPTHMGLGASVIWGGRPGDEDVGRGAAASAAPRGRARGIVGGGAA